MSAFRDILVYIRSQRSYELLELVSLVVSVNTVMARLR